LIFFLAIEYKRWCGIFYSNFSMVSQFELRRKEAPSFNYVPKASPYLVQ
jgi:hypothetical protein